jgi:hypothetical protein
MSVTNLRSKWDSGNLIFDAVPGLSTTPFMRIGVTDTPAYLKVHNRPTTSGSTIEVRSRPTSATATHFAVDSTLDWRPTGDTVTGGGCRALQGVARLDTGDSMTGGSLTGVYGQVANNGTMNGSGVMLNAIYGLIEDGGTYTAVSHLAVLWLDSHLDQTVTAGETEFVYISNNGDTTFAQAFFVYAGNKITNLFAIDTASGMVSVAGTAGTTTAKGWIKCLVEGVTRYIPLSDSVS